MTELTVGQTLWLVRHYPLGNGCEVTVTKIGRKWATLDGGRWGRCDKHSLLMEADQYSSIYSCWLSKEACEQEKLRRAAWHKLGNAVRLGRPDGVTLADIDAAAALLNIDWAELDTP